MKLRVTTPLQLVIEADGVRHVRGEDVTGAFGIQRGHAPFVTVLAISVVSWRDADGREHHIAVRGGVLSVLGDVAIATPEAVTGDDLAQLERDVIARYRREARLEQSAHRGAARLETAVIRRIYQYIRGERPRLVMPGEENGHDRR
jgi:F-type H+-transporting ATPase subunit epsilon